MVDRPTLAVWTFSSCDGCQLTLLDCEDQLLELAQAVEITHFSEATSTRRGGPYDISLVEGCIAAPDDLRRIREIREESKVLVAIGACATAGGIQALRNLADVEEYGRYVYPDPELVATLATATPASDHVAVDYELRGCPISKNQVLELLEALVVGRRPLLPTYPVCLQCKERGATCVMVARGVPCLGPITRAGCGAICPAFDRGCYGCFGPAETVNAASLLAAWSRLGVSRADRLRALRTFYVNAPAFRAAGESDAPD